MTNSLIQINLDAEKGIIEEIIKEIHALTQDIQHKELSQTVSDLRNRIHDPFMFVICGEVKVGKSSFINALLESKTEICKVAPSPMTDTIQLIVYGPEYQMTALSPVLKRIRYFERNRNRRYSRYKYNHCTSSRNYRKLCSNV